MLIWQFIRLAVIVAAVVGGVIGSRESDSSGNSSNNEERATADPEEGVAENGIGGDGTMVTME